jgi:hypothetical protein
LTDANLELQDNLDEALAEITRLRPIAEAIDSSEKNDPSLGWRWEPDKAAGKGSSRWLRHPQR